VELLVLTILDKLFLILQTLFTFFTKEADLMRKSTALSSTSVLATTLLGSFLHIFHN